MEGKACSSDSLVSLKCRFDNTRLSLISKQNLLKIFNLLGCPQPKESLVHRVDIPFVCHSQVPFSVTVNVSPLSDFSNSVLS